MTNLTDMAAFVAVVEHKSFSQAGRELRVSTAVISARVAKLEKQIGVRLLNRTTRQVALTEEAYLYFEDCKRILEQVEMAEAALSSRRHRPAGTLNISAPTVFGRRHLAPLLPVFQQDYPELQIRLHLSDGFVDLLKDSIDMAVRIATLPDSSLVARKLAESPRVLCAAPSYLARAGQPASLQDLLEHNCLLLRFPGSQQFQWEFEEAGRSQIIAVSGNLDSNNADVLREWALAGFGICLKSKWEVADDLKAGRLVEILPETPPRPVTVSAIYPLGNIVPPKVRLAIDFLKNQFKGGI
ncbi:MAG: LysR family transcriptional regulator [Sneathiella sp.]